MCVLECCMSFILQCHIWKKCIEFRTKLHLSVKTNAVLLLFEFCSYEFFFNIHNAFALSFLLTVTVLNMTQSQRLCLTIHHTKHLFRGQRKECCISTGLVVEKKPWCDNLNLIHRIDWGIVSSPFFLLAFPFVNTKLRWPINITWCGDAKQELMTGVCVWERERVYGRSLWDCA